MEHNELAELVLDRWRGICEGWDVDNPDNYERTMKTSVTMFMSRNDMRDTREAIRLLVAETRRLQTELEERKTDAERTTELMLQRERDGLCPWCGMPPCGCGNRNQGFETH